MYDDAEAHEKQLNRERMAEIRPRGKRGKSKKPRKPPRMSEARILSSTKVVNDIVAQLKLKVGKVSVKKTRRILQQLLAGKRVDELDGPILWKHLMAAPNKFSVRQHKKGYALALRHVLAGLEYVSTQGLGGELHINMIAELAGDQPDTRGFDPVKAMLFLLLDYLDEDGSIDKHDLSRDAAAIRYLLSQNVKSYTLEKWMKSNPGGVDKWSRLASKHAFSNADDHEEREGESKSAEGKVAEDETSKIDDGYYDDVDPFPMNGNWANHCNDPARCLCRHSLHHYRLSSGDSLWIRLFMPVSSDKPEIVEAIRLYHKGAPGRKRITDDKLRDALMRSSRKAATKIKTFRK